MILSFIFFNEAKVRRLRLFDTFNRKLCVKRLKACRNLAEELCKVHSLVRRRKEKQKKVMKLMNSQMNLFRPTFP